MSWLLYSAALNTGVHVPFYFMFFSGCMPRSPRNFFKRKLHLWTFGIPTSAPGAIFTTPWTVARQAPLSMGFSRKITGVGCHFLLKGIFLTQGCNLSLMSPALAGGFFTTNATWEIQCIHYLNAKYSKLEKFSTKIFLINGCFTFLIANKIR